jgi:hypothetical protein
LGFFEIFWNEELRGKHLRLEPAKKEKGQWLRAVFAPDG